MFLGGGGKYLLLMIIGNSQLRAIIREAIETAVRENRVDKYGNPIPKNGQGYGPDPDLQNRQGYNQDGSKGPWFSRSVAVATAVLLNDNGQWYVLAGQRGAGTPDYQGYWNLPCGYLDYNEDAKSAAAREVFEETGIRLSPESLKFFGTSSSPYENRQNVMFFFVAVLSGSKEKYGFSKANMEKDEVDGLQWLPIEKCSTLKWAFDHDELIQRVITKYSHLIHGDTEANGKDAIKKVISILQNDGDIDYAIKLLKKLL